MDSLRVDDGLRLTISRDCGDYNDYINVSFDEYPSEFYEKAYDTIKTLAKRELTPDGNGETFNLH